ncbi:MAG TPA: rhodanese-like domain-containing protein, partial [Burkholderiales bacterium]|nr:rhodanese-like domain-containing protein [Burkholderiales bacterium]
MALKKGIKQLLAEAEDKAPAISVPEAQKRLGDAGTVFVDIRDVRELEREGMIPGAFHAPRGMLEFWVDPESPYYKPVFTEDKTYILYCQSDWRGVLAAATLKEMGLRNVFHLAGGYGEWRKSGAPTGARPEKK